MKMSHSCKRKRQFIISKLCLKYRNLPLQVKASIWFLICSFFQKGISTLTTPIFTRIMSPSEYGHYNVFNSWMGIISIFVTMNLSYGVYTQGLIKFDKEKQLFSSSLQGLSAFMVSIWTGVYLCTRQFWNDCFSMTTVQMIAMLIMIWTTAVFNFWASEQRSHYQYRTLVAITVGISLAKPLLGIVLVSHAQDKVTMRILGLMLVELLGYAPLFFIQINRGKRIYSKKFWKYALSFNLPLIPHYLSQTVLNSADRIMIKNMVGADAARYIVGGAQNVVILYFLNIGKISAASNLSKS